MGTTWKAVTGASFHTCATQTDDTLWCWGRNDVGQIGDNHAWRPTFVRVP
jgi:alpha-tubulin suppressor-like RCC1 family protein